MGKKILSVLILGIIVLSVIVTSVGLFTGDRTNSYIFESVNGENVEIYGSGLYKNDSVSMTMQGKAQDAVTLFLVIPLLMFSYWKYRKGLFKGKILLLGILGYLLYTFISYSFLWQLNIFFILYVFLMSLSFFSFIIVMNDTYSKDMRGNFKESLPTTFLGSFQIIFGILLMLMWFKKIYDATMNGFIGIGLDHYSTLVIQALDVGFLLPVAIISGIMLTKKKTLGYLLSSIIIVKGFFMSVTIVSMIVVMQVNGISVNSTEIVVFSLLTGFMVFALLKLYLNTRN